MNTTSYTKKPITVEAVQLTPSMTVEEATELASWCGGLYEFTSGTILIMTLEGDMTASLGDYIIKGVQGEFYPCKPDIFEATYSLQEPDSVQLGGVLFNQDQFAIVHKMCDELAIPLPLDTDEASLVEQASAGMAYLLELQHKVESGWHRLPDHGGTEWESQYIREVVLCATDELHELLAEVHWKPWKQKSGIKDHAAYREELADVLHFVLDLYLVAGLTGADLVADYISKHKENISRITRTEYLES